MEKAEAKMNSEITYEKPALVAHGTIERMTQGNSSGTFFDVVLQVGQTFEDATFLS